MFSFRYGTDSLDRIQTDTSNGIAYLRGGDDFFFDLDPTSNWVTFGGAGDDNFVSVGGNDFIYAGHGDDVIVVHAREGQVGITGGRGNDTLIIVGDPEMAGFDLTFKGVENVVYHDF